MKILKTYQQGDVILKQVQDPPKMTRQKEYKMEHPSDKIILALGEGTGHHHRFEAEKLEPSVDVIGYGNEWSQRPNEVRVNGGNATLYHEEHNPLELPPGLYQVSIVRELDHLSGNIRGVID